MNCIIIGGFLGSGKTTFINYLIEHTENKFPDTKLALLINEFGEIPVDTAIVEEGNYSMLQVTGGCVCCTLKGMLADAVAEIKENENPDLLIIEATGLAVPSEIAALAGAAGGCSVYRLATVDAKQYLKFVGRLPIYDRQFDGEDAVLLTKLDLRDSEMVLEAEEALKSDSTRPCFSSRDEAARYIFSIASESGEEANTGAAAAGHHHEEDHHDDAHKHEAKKDIVQFTHRLAGPVNLSGLREALSGTASAAGDGIYRIKGIVDTEGGRKAVQFSDGEMSIKDLESADDGESFIVFIGEQEAVDAVKANGLPDSSRNTQR